MNVSVHGGVCIMPDYLSAPDTLAVVPYQPDFSYSVGFAFVGSLTKPMKLFLREAKTYFAARRPL